MVSSVVSMISSRNRATFLQTVAHSREACGPAKRRGRAIRTERGSPTARIQRADAQRLDSGERLAAGKFSVNAVRRDDD